MPVFARIRRVVKFMHRSLQRYRSHQKIFIELWDTALQSWTNFRKIQNPQRNLSIFVNFQRKSGRISMDFEWKADNANFWSVRKVFDFISVAKIDLSNWYCIHAYFIEIQMMEKFSFSIFSIFYGVFATFWLSGTSSRTVNAAKSLDFPVKFYQTLSQTHEKT